MAEISPYFDLLNILNAVVGLMANVLVQVLGFRYVAISSMLTSVIIGFVFGFVAVLLIQVGLCYFSPSTYFGQEFFAVIVTNMLIYSALGYCYFHFINLGETARRIRILRELDEAKNGLTLEEILARYNSKIMVAMRLKRLLDSGQVSIEHDRYYIKSVALLMTAKIITLMKLMVLGKKLGNG